jgi:hypothetical protein
MWTVYRVIYELIQNAFWIGAAIYAWRLWCRMREELTEQPSIVKTQRKAVARRYLKKFFVVAGVWYVVGWSWFYHFDILARKGAYDCERNVSTEDGGLYVSEKCFTPPRGLNGGGTAGFPSGYSILVRIYSAKTGELLVEDFIANPEGDFLWGKDYVMHQAADANGSYAHVIQLPPSQWQQFKAKLP